MEDKLLNDCLDYMKLCGYAHNTIYVTYKSTIKKFISHLHKNHIGIESVDTEVITTFLSDLKKSGLKKTTLYSYTKRLRFFFKYLRDKGYIRINPLANTNDVKKNLSEEFQKYYDLYVALKENEKTCHNSMKKIKGSIMMLFEYLEEEREIKTISEIRKADLKEFVKYLGDKKDKKGNALYRPTSINRYLSDLKTYVMWLSRKGKLPSGFSNNLIFMRKAQRISRNILTRKELVSLFSIKAVDLYGFMMKSIFVIQYASGLRINELLSLEKKDIDFDRKELKIYETKTGKERVVILGEVGTKYLKIFIDHVRPEVCYGANESDRIFLSCYEGIQLNANTVNRRLAKFVKKAGIMKKISSHSFRHSYGTHLLENGLGIKEVSSLMGHKDLVSTEHYTRLSPERLRKTIDSFHPRERKT